MTGCHNISPCVSIPAHDACYRPLTVSSTLVTLVSLTFDSFIFRGGFVNPVAQINRIVTREAAFQVIVVLGCLLMKASFL